MKQLFLNDRRRKAQLLELVERLGTPDFGAETDVGDALTRVKCDRLPAPRDSLNSAKLVTYARRAIERTRGKALVTGAVSTALLLGGFALTRASAEAQHQNDGRVLHTAIAASATPELAAGNAATAAPAGRAPTEPDAEVRSFELPQGKSYLLEITGTNSERGTLLFRIRPESRANALRKPLPASATPPPPASQPLNTAPLWLQQVMKSETNSPAPMQWRVGSVETAGRLGDGR
jgi:hypothetical protein